MRIFVAPLIAAVLAFALVLACGDPRLPFYGNYSGTNVLTVTLGSESQTTSTSTTVGMTEDPANDEQLLLGGSCGLTASLSGPNGFTLVTPRTCPPASTDGGCTLTFTVTQGSGTVSGSACSLSWGGNQIMACTGATYSGTFVNSFNGTRL